MSADASNPKRRAWWRYVVPPWWVVPYYGLILAVLYGFVLLAQGVYDERGFAFDAPLLTWLAQHQSRPLTLIALALNYLAISYTLGAGLFFASVKMWRNNRRSVIFLTLGFWGAVGVNLVAKEFFTRVRPDLFEQLTPITNSSFPSGHAMGSFALALSVLIVLLQLRVKGGHFWGFLGMALAVIVGISRNYLQVHYPSDVLAGWALSTAWVLGVGAWYTYGFRASTLSLEERRRLWRYVMPPPWVIPYYGLLLAVLYGFATLAQGVYDDRGFPFDTTILTWLAQHQSRPLTLTALALNYLAISYTLGAALLLVCLRMWRNNRRSAIFLTLGFWGAVGVNLVAKEFFTRVRPDLFEQLTPITNSSFPSGHAMGSFALALSALLVLLQLRVKNGLAWGLLGMFLAVIVGLSRNYLQVHYPSDVLAGWALSTAWVLGVGVWYTHGFRQFDRAMN